MSAKRGDVKLTPLSPTGFYSSAINNKMLNNLMELQERQTKIVENSSFTVTVFGKEIHINETQKEKGSFWKKNGFSTAMLTPDNTVVFRNSRAVRADIA